MSHQRPPKARPSGAPSKDRSDDRRRLGAEGERRAASYLKRRGYRIVEHNVRYGGVEIDLIARRGDTLAFVEVKTRRCRRFGSPESAVDGLKQERLIRGAYGWLRAHPSHRLRIRFDVIACSVRGGGPDEHWRIRHLCGAFDA